MSRYVTTFAAPRAHELVLTLSEGARDLAAGTVRVDYTLQIVKAVNRSNWHNGNTGNQSWSVTLGGVTVASGTSIQFNFDTVNHATPPQTSKTIATGSRQFNYNSDGTLSISVAFQADVDVRLPDGTLLMGLASYPSSGTAYFTPTPMQVGSPVAVLPRSANIGTTVAVNLARRKTSHTHTLTWASGALSGTIGTGVATTASFTVPNVSGQFPSQSQSPITITAATYEGATLVGTTSCVLLVWNSPPTIDPTSAVPFDVRLRRVQWDGARLRANNPLITFGLKLVDTYCSTPTLSFSTSSVVPGADDDLEGALVLLEVQNGVSWQSTGLLFTLSRAQSNDAEPTDTVNWSGTGYLDYVMARGYLVNDYKRTGSGTNAGNILRTLFTDAKARGWGPNVAAGFPAEKTTAGDGWIVSGGTRELSGGTPYSQILQAFVNEGWAEWRSRYNDADGVCYLDAFNAGTGIDWTAAGSQVTVNLSTGKITEAPTVWSSEEILDRVYAIGDAATNDPNTSADNTAAVVASAERTPNNASEYGVMEGWASASGQTAASGVREVAQNALDNATETRSRQFSYSAHAVSRLLLPYYTFKPGDWILIPSDRDKTDNPISLRVTQVSIDKNGDDINVTVVCGDLIPSGAAAGIAKKIKASTGGRISGGTLKDPVPLQSIIPAAPNFSTEEAAVSTGYWDSNGEPRSTIVFEWLPVTNALDGVTPLTVDYYEIWWRPNPGVPWALKTFSTDTSADIDGWPVGMDVQLRVRARATTGAFGEFSGYDEVTTLAPTASIEPLAVAALYTDGLGNIFADWDGYLGDASALPSFFAYMNAEVSPDVLGAPSGVWTIKGNSLQGPGTITLNPEGFGTWWVRFRAYDRLGGPGQNGTAASITTVDPGLVAPPTPNAPTGFSATAGADWDALGVSSGDFITVTWTAVTTDTDTDPVTIAYYEVEGDNGSGDWINVLRTSGIDGDLSVFRNTTWSYRVRAISDVGGVSAWSATAGPVTANATLTALQAPSAPDAGSSKGLLYVTWDGLDYLENPYANSSGFRYAFVEVASESDLEVRQNLWKNPSAETNSNGFQSFATAGVLARSTERAYVGTASIKFNTSSNQTYAGGTLMFGSSTTGSQLATVLPSTAYTGSVYVFTNADRYLRAAVNFRTSASVNIADQFSADIFVPANTWTRISMTATSPSNAAFGGVRIHQGSAGDRAYVAGTDFIAIDGILLEQTSQLRDYFDGSLTIPGMTYAWTGTAHASVSTAQVTEPWGRAGSAFPGRAGTAIISGLAHPANYLARVVVVDGAGTEVAGADSGIVTVVGVGSSDIEPGAILGYNLDPDFAEGATITGALVQTDAAADTGVKLASGGLVAYDGSGNPTFILDASSGSVWFGTGTISGEAIDVSTIDVGLLQASLITNGMGDALTIGGSSLVSIISGLQTDVSEQGTNLATYFDFGAAGQWKSDADSAVTGLRIASTTEGDAFNAFSFSGGFQIRRGATALSWWEADPASPSLVRFVAPNATVLNDLNVGSHKLRPGAAGVTILSAQ